MRHSSFMSTIEPLWDYSEIPRQKWTRRVKRSTERGAEFLLTHQLYKVYHQEWIPMDRTFTVLHFQHLSPHSKPCKIFRISQRKARCQSGDGGLSVALAD